MTISLIALGILLFLIFMRIPLFVAMAGVGTIGFAYLMKAPDASLFDMSWRAPMSMLTTRFLSTAQEYGLSVIPLFIYMGNIITRAGMSQELYNASYAFLGHRKGGLAMATVVACGGFASICGSSLATVATMSKVSMPPMKQRGYSDKLAAASIVAGGTLGILIPPSVILIIYGILTESSIRELFAAGFLPGLLGVILYLVAVKYVVYRNPADGPAGSRSTWQQRLTELRKIVSVLALFIVVLGGIYAGVFTPTEAAGIGAGWATIITIMRRKFNFKILREVLLETITTTGILFAVISAAMAMNSFVTRAGLPDELLQIVQSMDIAPLWILLIIMGIYLILGMFFDGLSMVLLTIPVFYPIVSGLGIDLIWFGILVVVVTEISLITPPIGMNIFVLSSMLPAVKTADIFKGVTPFWTADIIRLGLLIFIPTISMILPTLLYR